MVFYSKMDRYFRIMISIVLAVLLAATWIPLFFAIKDGSLFAAFILLGTFLLAAGLILSTVLYIRYIFKERYLVIRGGLFHSKIPYEHITKVAPTNDIFTGYRILSAKDALEITYTSGVFGSVKISPQDKQKFISQLRQHCPHVVVSEKF